MAEFVFSYRAPSGYRGSAETEAAWEAWFDALGPHLEDRGNPVFLRGGVGNCAYDTGLGGYSLISADNLDAAVALAKGCPILAAHGGVEVGELVPVPGRHHPARDF
jgi:fermentation-respiration switch protein FrsA (DUF1100 family)